MPNQSRPAPETAQLIDSSGSANHPGRAPESAGLPTMSFASYLRALDYFLDHGLPRAIGGDVWRQLYAQSLSYKVREGFRWLGWTTGRYHLTTPLLARIVDPASRQQALMDTLEARYAPVIASAQRAETTLSELQQAVGRAFGVRNGTAMRSVSFFLVAAAYAGIELAPQFARVAHKRMLVVAPMPTREAATTRPLNIVRLPSRRDEPYETDDQRSGFLMITELLVESCIPSTGPWTHERRDAFVQALIATLDVFFPANDDAPSC